MSKTGWQFIRCVGMLFFVQCCVGALAYRKLQGDITALLVRKDDRQATLFWIAIAILAMVSNPKG